MAALFAPGGVVAAEELTRPIVSEDLVFAEQDGQVAVEAEHFFRQGKTAARAFYRTTSEDQPGVTPDGDPSHAAGASGGAYLEILPDTRRTHVDKLIIGENFSHEPSKMAVLSYRVHFSTPGRYYVWARVFSTGAEDNGLHVGLDGRWPASGRQMQWTAKRKWFWDIKQRTADVHSGVPGRLYLDIESPGMHVISFSMREDGFEFDKWLMTTQQNLPRPQGVGPAPVVHTGTVPPTFKMDAADTPTPPKVTGGQGMLSPTSVSSKPLKEPRRADGDASVAITGEKKQWHKVTLTLDGPFAHEQDNSPNPFLDYRLTVEFRHESGSPKYIVPGYFAADGDAGESSAESGTKWRAHVSPDKTGRWDYRVSFARGKRAAIDAAAERLAIDKYDGLEGSFEVARTDKTGRDLRAQGRLQYTGERYLRFAGTGKYFLKAGADAPETLLGYADFDNTVAGKPDKVPLKTWGPHVKDWRRGDPTWQGGKGKGLIGAINYLSGKGCNAFSFLTYNAGGDGDNVWPFIHRNDKLHYDCSKLDQWSVVFDHGARRGMYLHFKMQETENDDNRRGHAGRNGIVRESLDGGRLGPQRKLYCRELIARYAHHLALNWNIGEENTQSTEEQKAMLAYIAELDPYGHNRVLHTYPNQQEATYRALMGEKSALTGLSLQNSAIGDTHWQTAKWVRETTSAGRPLVVAFDESGNAAHGQVPDLDYQGFDGRDVDGTYVYTEHEVRKQTLWGTLLAGGAGVEYYFGYKLAENDLRCEDWRSRDRSWDYCRIALEFFADNDIPFWEMANHNRLVGNGRNDNSKYCFAKPGELYLVYLPDGQATQLDLRDVPGEFAVGWFNPRTGGPLELSNVTAVTGGEQPSLGEPPPVLGKTGWLSYASPRSPDCH